MYDINKTSDDAGESILEDNSEQKDDMKPESDPELGNDQELSYRKLFSISNTFKFTDTQLNLIKDKHENIFMWSVAVSDKSFSSSEFRLLAISFISLEDMKYYKENSNKMHPMEICNHGFTFVFIISYINSDYSIHDIDDKEIPIKYGGIVKLFSEKDYKNNQKVEKVEQMTDKNNQNADGYILILLTLSGIYKYLIKNKSIKNIQKFKYPRRIYNVFINYLNLFFGPFGYTLKLAYEIICDYIRLCLNKQYFLVDTIMESIEYMELYDLKTNQLINTFQRQISRKSIMVDIWPNFAISDNEKLLVYLSIKKIKIYSIECGLEIMEIDVENIDYNGMYRFVFFHNDEILLMYYKDEWSVCNIFGSLRDSVKLEKPEFIGELKMIEPSKSFMVVDNGDKIIIYDDLFVDKYLKYLKRNTEQDWKKLSKEDLNNNIQEPELDKYHNMFEPWHFIYDNLCAPQYWFYLDENKEKILLIGNHSIQVWYDRGPEKGPKKRSLEFIYVPLSQLPFPQKGILDIWEAKTIKVMDIKCCIGKFNLNIQIEDIEGSLQIKQIKMEDEDDIINVVKYACYALKYFSVYKIIEQIFNEEVKLKFYDTIEETRKIILRFIRLYPITWRLLDFRFDLMSVIIEAGDHELLNDILSFRESIHIPQYFSWSGEGGISTIRKAFSDRTMLACFLEYYSNNAVNNIEWMNTVVDIIPELYEYNKENNGKEKVESYIYYAHKLFYNPCFYNKQLDLLSFEFLEISPRSSDLLKVFIPITQLIPQDSELDLQEINKYENIDIRMVPLVAFATNKIIPDIRERKFTDFLKLLISPSRYSSLKEEDYSPFIRIIIKGERDMIYENPSMGAVMNWMWHCSKFYWPRTLYIYALYFLTYSIISWAYLSHIQISETYQHILIITTIILFYYLSYYHIVVEIKQFYRKGRQYYLDLFNWVDLLSLIIPIFILSYVLICYYTFDGGFKNAESNQILTFIMFLSILVLWYEFILLLRIYEGFAHNLNILLNIIISIRQFLLFFILVVIAMGHALFTLLGHPSYIGLNQSSTTYDPFSNLLDSIFAVYDWSSISFDIWNFWQLTIISIVGSFMFVMILQNVIISFMSDAFSDAVKDSKRGVYRFQIDYIHEFALLEKSVEFNKLDSKFKDKIRAKYICFQDDPQITNSWKETSEKMKSKPYPKIKVLNKSGFESWLIEDCKFIWEKDEKDIEYWFL
ncbi:transient receptor potential channel pyrexia-like [Gigaspora margarita]|nr:transient receptor potential channel pyrexia-like [Gigaspora margarita]